MPRKIITKKYLRENHTHNRGFIALTTVIIATLIIVLAVFSITIQSIDESQVSVAYEKYKQSQYDTESCLEEILFNLSKDEGYTVSGEYSISIGSDTILCENVEIVILTEETEINITSGEEFVNNLNVMLATTTPSIVISSYSTY